MPFAPKRAAAFALLAVLAAAGCASILGLPDYGASGGAGGAGGTSSHGTASHSAAATAGTGGSVMASASAATGTGGSAPACAGEGAPCYDGLDGTEGVGPCKGGTLSCKDGGAVCDDVRPVLQACGAPPSDGNCDGIPACTGQFRWSYGALPEAVTALAAGLDGAVAVAGGEPITTDAAFVAAFDARGRACWAAPTSFGGAGMLDVNAVALAATKRTGDGRVAQVACHGGADAGADLAGDTIVVGAASGMVDFGLGAHASAGTGTDAFVAAFGPTGKVAWGMLFGSTVDDVASSVAVGADGTVYVAGYFKGPVTLAGCAPATGALPGSPNAFAAALTPGGSCKWLKTFAGNTASTGIAVDYDGNLVVIGRFETTTDFGQGVTLQAGAVANSTFVVKLASATGDALGPVAAIEAENAPNYDPKLAVGPSGDVLVAGAFYGSYMINGNPACLMPGPMLNQGYFVRLDAAFAQNAPHCFSGSSDVVAYGVAVDTADDAVVALASATAITGGGTPIGAGGLIAVKLGPSPYTTPPWAQSFGTTTTAYGTGLAVDGMGDVVMTGNANMPIDLGEGVSPANQAVLVELAP